MLVEADPEMRSVCKGPIKTVLSGQTRKGMGKQDMAGEDDN